MVLRSKWSENTIGHIVLSGLRYEYIKMNLQSYEDVCIWLRNKIDL